MKVPIAQMPQPPTGYTMYTQHAASGWQMWVPPATADRKDRIQLFQFRNPPAGFVVTPQGQPSVTVGSNTDVYPDEPHQVFVSDIQNGFDRTSQKPRLPRFVALWIAYLISIRDGIHSTEVFVKNVANEELRKHLVKLGFQEALPDYLGVFATIKNKIVQECRQAGWEVG